MKLKPYWMMEQTSRNAIGQPDAMQWLWLPIVVMLMLSNFSCDMGKDFNARCVIFYAAASCGFKRAYWCDEPFFFLNELGLRTKALTIGHLSV